MENKMDGVSFWNSVIGPYLFVAVLLTLEASWPLVMIITTCIITNVNNNSRSFELYRLGEILQYKNALIILIKN